MHIFFNDKPENAFFYVDVQPLKFLLKNKKSPPLHNGEEDLRDEIRKRYISLTNFYSVSLALLPELCHLRLL